MALTDHTNGTARYPKRPHLEVPQFKTDNLGTKVKHFIRECIARGELKGQLPAMPALALQLNVSGGTVRTALDELEAEGVLERMQGIGTFVREPIAWRDLQRDAISLFAALGRFRPADDPTAKMVVAVDAEGADLMEDDGKGNKVPLTRSAHEFRMYAKQAAAVAAWLEQRALLAAAAKGAA